MKTVKEKQILVGADFAGFPLKEAVVEHLRKKGWTITDIGVKSADEENPEMFHRIGLKAGAMITEKEFERALLFCGTGMGIHIAASKCPGVHAGVVESVPGSSSRNNRKWSQCACHGCFLCGASNGKGHCRCISGG